MTDAQRHRGPDDAGLEVIKQYQPTVIFGHRRLAIIDLSSAGHQPMCDPDTGNWITFNGEIYNFREIRHHLERRGIGFRTQTDTEVILKAYAVWGEVCLEHFRGMFAFALWDQNARRLFCARDRLGIKPLYYYTAPGMLLFASEVRALLATGWVPRRLDPHGLRSYLTYGSVQEPLTLVTGVRSLGPGHLLIWQDGRIQIRRYWHLPPSDAVQETELATVTDEVLQRLEEAVRLRLVADVPLGAFLSGGIDSTAIAALMQRTSSEPVKTFAVIFDEADYDERTFARRAAKHIGTDHTELHLSGEAVRAELPRALAAFDQPSMDGLNTYFVSKVTKEAGLTVALSGVGGDELFGGYSGYRKTLWVDRWGRYLQSLPRPLRENLHRLLVPISVTESFRQVTEVLLNCRHPYFVSRQLFSTPQVSKLLRQEVFASSLEWFPERFDELVQESRGFDLVNRASLMELQTYMVSTLLRDTDQMSMAHALEVRVPLIDHKVVEYLFTVPGAYKVDPRIPKPLLTEPLGVALPRECVYRSKMGFTLPFEVWLRQALRVPMEETFLSKSNGQDSPLVEDGLEWLWQQFRRGRVSWSRVWTVFVLLVWLESHRVRL